VFPESIWLCILPRISNQQTCRSRAASANLPPTVRYSIKICNGMVLKIYLVNNNSTWQELFVVYSMYKLPILSCVHFTKSTLKSHVILLLKTRNSHVILLRESRGYMQEFCIVSTKCLCYTAFSSQNQIRKGLCFCTRKRGKVKNNTAHALNCTVGIC
jgi:hypothetical protein